MSRTSAPRRRKSAPTNTGDDLLAYTVPEAGRLLGLSRNSAYDAARNKKLPCVRIGGRLIVPRAALMRLLDGAQVATTAETSIEHAVTGAATSENLLGEKI
jgi:excisionase family DNA binding protein